MAYQLVKFTYLEVIFEAISVHLSKWAHVQVQGQISYIGRYLNSIRIALLLSFNLLSIFTVVFILTLR